MAVKPLKELVNRQIYMLDILNKPKNNIQKHPKETRSSLNNLICGKVSISINLYFTFCKFNTSLPLEHFC